MIIICILTTVHLFSIVLNFVHSFHSQCSIWQILILYFSTKLTPSSPFHYLFIIDQINRLLIEQSINTWKWWHLSSIYFTLLWYEGEKKYVSTYVVYCMTFQMPYPSGKNYFLKFLRKSKNSKIKLFLKSNF